MKSINKFISAAKRFLGLTIQDKVWFAVSHMFPLHAPSDKFVIWNGTAWELNEPRWGTFCAELENRGVNMMRWLGWNSWFNWFDKTLKKNLTPFLREENGLYDLSKRSADYWRIAERMVEIMNYPSQKPGNKAPGATLWMDLAYQYQKDADDVANSPWRNNTQGIKSLYDPKAWPIFEAYMLEWFAMGKRRKIVFGMGNEGVALALDFYYKMLTVMDRERIWPFSWGICAEVPSPNGNDLFKKLVGYIDDHGLFLWHPLRKDPLNKWDTSVVRPVHGCSLEKNKHGIDVFKLSLYYWLGHSIRFFLSDDGDMDENGKPGVDLWRAAIRYLFFLKGPAAVTRRYNGIEWPNVGIEHLPDDEPWDESRAKQLAIIEAMGAELERGAGKLANRGAWPDAWQTPDAPPVKPPVGPTAPEKPGFNLKGWWNNRIAWLRRKWGWIALLAIVGLLLALVAC